MIYVFVFSESEDGSESDCSSDIRSSSDMAQLFYLQNLMPIHRPFQNCLYHMTVPLVQTSFHYSLVVLLTNQKGGPHLMNFLLSKCDAMVPPIVKIDYTLLIIPNM